MKDLIIEELKACPSCKEPTFESDMNVYNGERMCEGCCETQDMFDQGDPLGRDWNC